MEQLTLQQIFDNAWNAFVVRGEGPGYDEKERCCKYRAPNGCKCAIGHSITDDLYARHGESNLVNYPIFRKEDHDKLISLQFLHDNSVFSRDFRCRIKTVLKNFSKGNNLAIPAEATA